MTTLDLMAYKDLNSRYARVPSFGEKKSIHLHMLDGFLYLRDDGKLETRRDETEAKPTSFQLPNGLRLDSKLAQQYFIALYYKHLLARGDLQYVIKQYDDFIVEPTRVNQILRINEAQILKFAHEHGLSGLAEKFKDFSQKVKASNS